MLVPVLPGMIWLARVAINIWYIKYKLLFKLVSAGHPRKQVIYLRLKTMNTVML
jgi:hypothetical protein